MAEGHSGSEGLKKWSKDQMQERVNGREDNVTTMNHHFVSAYCHCPKHDIDHENTVRWTEDQLQ